jgi:hypothetical protein
MAQTASRFPIWEIRHLDGRQIASTSMGYSGLHEWVRVAVAIEHDCRPSDITFIDDASGDDWILVERITGWDVTARDFATVLARVGYYQMRGQPIRDCEPVHFLQAAE